MRLPSLFLALLIADVADVAAPLQLSGKSRLQHELSKRLAIWEPATSAARTAFFKGAVQGCVATTPGGAPAAVWEPAAAGEEIAADGAAVEESIIEEIAKTAPQ